MLFRHEKRHQISLLVPFQSHDRRRLRVWRWLRRYWRDALPGCEIVIGKDRASEKTWYRRHPKPFSKAVAVDHAFQRSHGDIIVILDADAYLSAHVIKHCAERIRFALSRDIRLWFVPYLKLYRLTRTASNHILRSDPCDPLVLSSPPPACDIESREGSGLGHFYGAMIQIMPREAFEIVGGMDPRFRGWGGEDVAFLRALDTLYGKHKNTPNDVLHLWHPQMVSGSWDDSKGKKWTVRIWEGQTSPRANDKLATRYHKANGDPVAMKVLVDEGHEEI